MPPAADGTPRSAAGGACFGVTEGEAAALAVPEAGPAVLLTAPPVRLPAPEADPAVLVPEPAAMAEPVSVSVTAPVPVAVLVPQAGPVAAVVRPATVRRGDRGRWAAEAHERDDQGGKRRRDAAANAVDGSI